MADLGRVLGRRDVANIEHCTRAVMRRVHPCGGRYYVRSYGALSWLSNWAGVITGGRCDFHSSRSLSPETMTSTS